MLIDRTITNVTAKLGNKVLNEFCEIGKNVNIGIFGLFWPIFLLLGTISAKQ